MSDKSKFFLVWTPNGHNPTKKHDHLGAAKKEAARLATENPSQKFYIMESICFALKNDVLFVDTDEDDIPF